MDPALLGVNAGVRDLAPALGIPVLNASGVVCSLPGPSVSWGPFLKALSLALQPLHAHPGLVIYGSSDLEISLSFGSLWWCFY